ncbi:MAG: TauD/TfdA dioxygenase family protein, partial [Alphaproteobacteria bacterium]
MVRDQDLTPAEYVAATKLFGEPTHQYFSDMIMEGQPEIIVLDSRDAPILPNGEPRLVGSGAWHTDHTNTPCPPKATVLYAIKLPSSGGTTGFANMRKAYAALPQEERT